MKVYSRIVTKIFIYVCNNIIKKQKQKKTNHKILQ